MKANIGNLNIPSNVRGSIGNRKKHWSKISKCLILILFFLVAIWPWKSYFISLSSDFHVYKMGLTIYARDQNYVENHCLSESLFKNVNYISNIR